MLSRVAENIFWMGRYLERTNITIRNLQTHYIAFQDGTPLLSWDGIAAQYGCDISDLENNSPRAILHKIIFDKNNDNSVVNNIFKARENARSAQDNITKELWQCLNDFYHLIQDKNIQQQVLYNDPIYTLDSLIKQCMLSDGIVNNSMSRNEGFYFLSIGNSIERSLQCIGKLKKSLLLKGNTYCHIDDPSWRYILHSLNGYENYLQKNAGVFSPKLITNQLIYEQDYPYSILYALNHIFANSKKLRAGGLEETNEAIEFAIGHCISFLKYTQPK